MKPPFGGMVRNFSLYVRKRAVLRGLTNCRARFGRPKASSLIPLGARIAVARFARAVGVGLPEAKPSREAVARGRAKAARISPSPSGEPEGAATRGAELCAGVAGWPCAVVSLSMDKGATPAGGGKPSAADSE